MVIANLVIEVAQCLFQKLKHTDPQECDNKHANDEKSVRSNTKRIHTLLPASKTTVHL